MKLRLTESSVRLRLRRSEVEAFRRDGSVEVSTHLPAGESITYRLTGVAIDQPAVALTAGLLEIRVPAGAARQWASTDQVGLYYPVGALQILVEKDFRRTSAPSPDDDDRYPNPRSAAPR